MDDLSHTNSIANWIAVTDASRLLNVSVDTIRRWEKKGLIKGKRDLNGHRLFQKSELILHNNKLNGGVGHEFEILKAKTKSPYKVIELFAGAGGLALGMENAGLNCVAAVEIDKNAAQTLRINRPNWNVIQDDVANVNFSEGEADIITGGFPCQAFSYAGKRLGFEDIRGTLFFEYARIIKQVQPKIIIGENVKGLQKHDNGKTLAVMLAILDDIGYHTRYRVLRAQYFDVAQKRERLVIIGIRKDLDLNFVFPKEQNYTISLKAALVNLPLDTDQTQGQLYTQKKKDVMSLVPQGGCWRDLPDDIRKTYMGASYFLGGGKTGMARRLAWDEPSLTLTCNPAQKQTERCHPSQTRPLNVREYARIQSFPDDWQFFGSISSQYKQMGNAVPVNLGFHIGRCLVACLDCETDDTMEVIARKPC
jgi:DNA (cytosine-5)-methyltransferase 1